jgi:poly(A) polymerase
MAAGNWAKSHHSAVVIIPPEEVWEPIQALRRKYDRQIHRWMPHINLLYPFVAEQHFQEVMPLAAICCGQSARLSAPPG